MSQMVIRKINRREHEMPPVAEPKTIQVQLQHGPDALVCLDPSFMVRVQFGDAPALKLTPAEAVALSKALVTFAECATA